MRRGACFARREEEEDDDKEEEDDDEEEQDDEEQDDEEQDDEARSGVAGTDAVRLCARLRRFLLPAVGRATANGDPDADAGAVGLDSAFDFAAAAAGCLRVRRGLTRAAGGGASKLFSKSSSKSSSVLPATSLMVASRCVRREDEVAEEDIADLKPQVKFKCIILIHTVWKLYIIYNI